MTTNEKHYAVRSKKRQTGLSTVEYAIAGSVVLIVTVIAFATLGDAAGGTVQDVAQAIEDAR